MTGLEKQKIELNKIDKKISEAHKQRKEILIRIGEEEKIVFDKLKKDYGLTIEDVVKLVKTSME